MLSTLLLAITLTVPQDTARDTTVRAADSVAAIAQALKAQGGAVHHAFRVAEAVHKYATATQLSPALIVGVIGIENRELNPTSRSSVGATGIMQVMPHWRSDIRNCGTRLYDIDTNVCFGTRILKQNIDQTTSLPAALRRYVGCLKSRGCGTYVQAVLSRVRAAERAIALALGDST